MKIAAKIINLAWGGCWSVFALAMMLREFSWNWFRHEPWISLLVIGPIAWIVFVVGLLFNRPWAWWGSFALAVFSVFGGIWTTMLSVTFGEIPIGEAACTMIALTLTALLLAIRKEILPPPAPLK